MIWLFRSIVVLLAYLGMNIYTGFRVLGLVKIFLPSLKAFVFWPFYLLLCYSFILIMLLRLDRILVLRQAGMYALPFFLYFFLALLTLDGLRFLLQYLDRLPRLPGLSAQGTAIALGLALVVMILGTIHARNIRTVNYNITIDKKASGQLEQAAGLRIALISDLHIGATVGRKWVSNIVDAVNKTEPDIIFMAGDIFDNSIEAIRDPNGVTAELLRLSAPLGVYAIPGNHDVDRLNWREEACTERIHGFLKNAGIILLQDEVELVADSFYIVGRRDVRPIGLSESRKSAAELAAGLETIKPIIFLDHQPVDFPLMEAAGADLIFSGHTHKGQFFPGNLATERIFRRAGAVHYGHWQGRSAQGVITSGAAVWGPPIRIATISEVVVVNVKFTSEVQRDAAYPEKFSVRHFAHNP